MKRHKILYTICTHQLAGTERQLLTLCKYLREKFDIYVALPTGGILNDKLKKLDIPVINVNFNHIVNLRTIFKLVRVIRKKEIDIVHNHLGKSAFLGTLAGRLAGVKCVVTTRHFIKPAYTHKGAFKNFISLLGHKFINKLNTKLIAVSDKVRESTMKREKVDCSRITTIYNGTDLKPKEAEDIKSYKIGIISRLSKEKGIDYLIDAMPQILKQFPDAKCLIAGIGPDKEELEKKVKSLDLSDEIKFLSFVDDIKRFLKKIDVFVLPAIEEPFGIAIVEAQIRGKPVISTNAGGPKEIIKHNETGLLVLPMDSKALGNAVISLFKDGELAKELAVRGQKRAIELFTAKKMANETEKLYESLLNPSLERKKKKVLIIGHHFVTKNNQRRIEELAKFNDLDIALITPKWWHEESRKVYLEKDYDKDYAIYKGETIFTGHNAFSFYIASLFKLLWRIKPDIIELSEEPWSLTTFQTLLFKKLFLPRSKVIFYSAQNINKKYPFPFNWIEKFTHNNADGCNCCNSEVIEVLHTKGYNNKVKVIPLGYDDALFRKVARKIERSENFQIGFVGHLTRQKGILLLLEALTELDNNFKLIIIGDGPLWDEIKRRVERLKLENRVDLAGKIPHHLLPDYYKKMDVLILPSVTTESIREQFGRVIVEAMACGIPVIGSNSGAIPEVIKDCGLIFKEGNVGDLVSKIKKLKDNPTLQKELSEKGYNLAINNYTYGHRAKGIYEIYKDLSKKKVLFLDHTAKASGGEIYLLEVLRHLDNKKITPLVVLGSDGYLADTLRKEKFDIKMLSLPGSIAEMRRRSFNLNFFKKPLEVFVFVKYVLKIVKIIKRNKIDIIYTNSIKSDIYGGLAARLTGRKCVWHLHDIISSCCFPLSLCKFIVNMSKLLADKIICNSKECLKCYLRMGGLSSKALVIPNGINLNKFTPKVEYKVGLNGKPHIGMIGRISPSKGQDVFLHAATLVKRKVPDARFIIVGDALFGEGKYKDSLLSLAEKFNLKSNLEFLGLKNNIPEILIQLDVLVHASLIPESFGLTVAEGMAVGLPVIAPKTGGILEIIENEKNGLLYEPGNYKELARSIMRVLENKNLSLTLSNNAKETIRNKFDIKKSVKDIEDLLYSVH